MLDPQLSRLRRSVSWTAVFADFSASVGRGRHNRALFIALIFRSELSTLDFQHAGTWPQLRRVIVSYSGRICDLWQTRSDLAFDAICYIENFCSSFLILSYLFLSHFFSFLIFAHLLFYVLIFAHLFLYFLIFLYFSFSSLIFSYLRLSVLIVSYLFFRHSHKQFVTKLTKKTNCLNAKKFISLINESYSTYE